MARRSRGWSGEKWDTYDFDARLVGKVDDSGQGIDIYLNLDFDKLQEVLGNPSYTIAMQETRKSASMHPNGARPIPGPRIGAEERSGPVRDQADARDASLMLLLVATDMDGSSASSLRMTRVTDRACS